MRNNVGEAGELPEERRTYRRYQLPAAAEIVVAVGALGLKPTNGVTLNMSRGGLLVRLAYRTFRGTEGAECSVRFLYVEDEVRPHSTLGVVRRLNAGEGFFFVAIEFLEPLEALNLPSFMASP